MKKINFGMNIGIDLGSTSVKIYKHGGSLALNEPAMVAVDLDTDETLAFGIEAKHMQGRTPAHIAVVSPLEYGRIKHFRLAENMLTEYVKTVCGNRVLMPRVVVCVPSGVSTVERREVVESLRAAGARKVCLIETVLAAALGAGLDISQPKGCMVCDIGGGTTDIGIITMNGSAVSHWIKYAGNSFNESLIEYVRERRGLVIGEKTAELLKRELGCVIPRERSLTVTAKGRNAVTGMPDRINISSDEMLEAFEEPAVRICRAVQDTLGEAPPALAGDLMSNGGLMLTGGGANLYGMDQLLAERTKLNVTIADEASLCVVKGTDKAIKYMDASNKFERDVSPLDVY